MTDPITTLIMSLSSFLGSVGSFQRIQEFLEKNALVDKRLVASESSSSEDFFKGVGVDCSEKSNVTTNEVDLTRVKGTKFARSLTPTQRDAIIVQNCDFSWDSGKDPLLRSINMSVPEGKISIVVGPVGCGKSTLLKAILGENPPITWLSIYGYGSGCLLRPDRMARQRHYQK